jgi:hypothetical protein
MNYKVFINNIIHSQGSTSDKELNITLNSEDFTQKTGNYTVRVEIEDIIGNQTLLEKVFTIVPDDISAVYSSISIDGTVPS